jgi:hypothetical protein
MDEWQRKRGGALHMGSHRVDQRMDDGSPEFTMDELREFLEGDSLDVRADPEFKDGLRRKLWEMMRARRRQSSGEDPA